MRLAFAIIGTAAALTPLQSIEAGPLGPVSYDVVAGQVRASALDHSATFRRSSTVDCVSSTGKLVGQCSIRFNDAARFGHGAMLGYLFFRSGYNFADIARSLEENVSETRLGQRIVRYHQTMMLTPRDRSTAVPFQCFEAYGRSNSVMSCALAVTTNAVITVDINPAHDSSTEQSADRDTEGDVYHALEFMQFAVTPFTAPARQRFAAARPQQEFPAPSDIWKETGPVSRGQASQAPIGQLTAFDLHCTGTMVSGGKSSPHVATYHVDLRTRKYCSDKCLATLSLVSDGPTKLLLDYTDTPTNKNETSIDRRTGAWLIHADQDYGRFQYKAQTNGTCTQAAFTGIKPRKRL